MNSEWCYIIVVAAVTVNFVYNAFPQSKLSHNLFYKTPHALVIEGKEEVEAEVKNRNSLQSQWFALP